MQQTLDSEDAPWALAVSALAARVAGLDPDRLRFLVLPGEKRRFRYSGDAGVLTIAATDGISASVGLHAYLREILGLAIHWDTVVPIVVPGILDSAPVEREARVADQYMFNFCTFSYTMAYWEWAEWEREIDWMALHGVTMPLAAVGYEAALLDAYVGLGLDEGDVLEFIGANVYAAFTFMGNLDSAIGPQSREQIEARATLGRRILDRERELGMTPVLPAFTGNVPHALFPSRVTPRGWQGFTTHMLSPEDPGFALVTSRIAQAQVDRFGTDHLYASDPFIEMVPVDDDQDYPGLLASVFLRGLTEVDPQATWVLQSWPFSYQAEFWTGPRVQAFLASIPTERILVLDLWAEEDPQWDAFDGFFGRPWVWCALLNFGGRSEPIGDVQRALDEFERSLASSTPPVGLGLTMEATRNNPFYFELISDLAWTRIPDVGSWAESFVIQRYGAPIPEAHEAWRALVETVYGASGQRVFPEDFLGLLTRRPTTALASGGAAVSDAVRSLVWYPPARLTEALELLTRAAEKQPEWVRGPLGHDIADVSVAWMSRLFDALVARLASESDAGTRPSDAAAAQLLELIDSLDAILATRPEMRLTTWLGRGAESDADRAARQIVTSWNAEPRHQLDDYAARMWHGLLGYYRNRWAEWLRRDEGDLELRLDNVWRAFMVEGPTEHPRDESETALFARRALERFGSTYAAVVTARDERGA